MPTPPLPEHLVFFLWTLGSLVALASLLWGFYRWLDLQINERISLALNNGIKKWFAGEIKAALDAHTNEEMERMDNKFQEIHELMMSLHRDH